MLKKDEIVYYKLPIKRELRKQFKMKTVEKDIRMCDFLNTLIEDFVNEN